MPRDGSLNYHAPFPDVAPDTTIASTVYNGFVNDIVQEVNTPLPVSRGGTGGTDPASAMANLGGELFAQVVTNYDSFAFQPGSFHSLGSATASPVATHAFSGIPKTSPYAKYNYNNGDPAYKNGFGAQVLEVELARGVRFETFGPRERGHDHHERGGGDAAAALPLRELQRERRRHRSGRAASHWRTPGASALAEFPLAAGA
jgi:hypothetical protein